MIRRVQHIKSFGVFADFQWPASLPEFKRFNLIYGWNYSGKTTLSRAFRCFEMKQRHMDFSTAQVLLRATDGMEHSLSSPETAPLIRVFNSDFVHDNLSFDSQSANPILVLGAADIAKQLALKSKREERNSLVNDKDFNERAKQSTTSTIERALTTSAREIKNRFKVPNYDKTSFEPRVTACKGEPETHLLGDAAFEQTLAVYNSTDKKPDLSRKIGSLTSVSKLREKAAAILARVVTANVPILRLVEDPTLAGWVEKGRVLHQGKSVCQFCEQPLPVDLLSRLASHFSADYESLMGDLAALLNEIKNAQKEGIALDHKADFYPELSDKFTNQQSSLESLLASRKSTLETLEKALVAKQSEAFSNLECPEVDDYGDQITSTLGEINKTICEHNARTAQFDEKRANALAKLEMHYAASFVQDQQYNGKLQQVEDLSSTINNQATRLSGLDTEIADLERELSDALKGADRINELLRACFGKDDLRIEVTTDNRFQIVRAGTRAKNLSEGEETAIAFAYFMTRVQDGQNQLSDTTIVIDDPVSSLDANHLFNTYALVKTRLGDCGQLFVLTHSFEFYNLIKEWAADEDKLGKKPQSDWKHWGIFLIRRTDDGKALLEPIPKELLRFKSEYHYLFWRLYQFDRSGPGDLDSLSLPNIARRFMEAFGGIMIPRYTGLRGKMVRLFPDGVERERAWKFMNHYSHNETVTRSLTIPDISECKAMVEACLRAVRSWDNEYFKDLESEIL